MPSSRRPRTLPYRVTASSFCPAPRACAGKGTLIAAATDSELLIIALRVIPEPITRPPFFGERTRVAPWCSLPEDQFATFHSAATRRSGELERGGRSPWMGNVSHVLSRQ